MKKILFAMAAIGLALPALAADLTSEDKAWLKANKVVLPIPFHPNQVTGLHWLLNHDCPPGEKTVGGMPLTCKGDKLADINNYLDLVAVSNFMDESDASKCKHPAKRTGPPLIDKPGEQLNPGEQAWLQDHGIKVLPLQMTAEQIAGMRRLMKSGCKAGKRKVGGIEMECKGEAVADTNNFLDLVSTANFLDASKCDD